MEGICDPPSVPPIIREGCPKDREDSNTDGLKLC